MDRQYYKLVNEEGVPAPIGAYRGFEIENLRFIIVPDLSDRELTRWAEKLRKELLEDERYRRELRGERPPAIIVSNRDLRAYRWIPTNEED